MGFIAVVGLIVTIYMVANDIGGGSVLIPILITLGSFIMWFIGEGAKDEQARRNARDYWLKRGSGVRDKRYNDRRRRR